MYGRINEYCGASHGIMGMLTNDIKTKHPDLQRKAAPHEMNNAYRRHHHVFGGDCHRADR